MIKVLAFLCLLLPGIATAEVIVNSGVTIDSIGRQYLLSVFSMRVRSWPDGQPVRVFVLPEHHDIHRDFVKRELKVFPYQLKTMWDRLVFSGAGQSPVVVESQEEMIERVSVTAGAIGYVAAADQGGTDVKHLEVK